MTKKQIKSRCLQIMATAPVAYLTTIDAKRGPQTRAMLNLRNTEQFPGLQFLFRSPNSKFLAYFTTNASSQKLAQIGKSSRAAVYYCLPDQWHGFMIGGPIEVVTDRKLKDRIWRDDWTMYYPGGKGDPDYTVLLLRPGYIKGWLSPPAGRSLPSPKRVFGSAQAGPSAGAGPVKFEIALDPAH